MYFAHFRRAWATGRLALLLAVILLQMLATAIAPKAGLAAAPEGWRDTGIDLPGVSATALGSSLCIDPTRPHTIILREDDGTYTYDWEAGPSSRRRLNGAALRACSPASGLFYGELSGQPVRFILANPTPQPIAMLPTYLAEDSSPNVYALAGEGRIKASPDGGATWQERVVSTSGHLLSLTVAAADARVLYAAIEIERPAPGTVRYAIRRSLDAGATWEERSTGEFAGDGTYGGPYVKVSRVEGRAAPVGLLTLSLDQGYPGSSNVRTIRISSDGGASFRDLVTESADSFLLGLFYAGDGLVMRYFTSFKISHDFGATFQPLPGPFSFNTYNGHTVPVSVAAQGPANLFAAGEGKLFHSPDSGQTWQAVGEAPSGYLVTPFAPFSVLGLFGERLKVRDLPDADRSETRGTSATDAPGAGYADPTQHNLPALFKRYWDAHGGLAQFGYPQTEPFREVSATDGKVYLVQYFERNRFEYHPENAGTDFDVLLGLLGNDLTRERRANGEEPFARAADPANPGQIYFPETGHTLRNSFRRYWESHGGLALYGYPISEEFYEVNPDNGQTYVVQYFERNRFEWHPENVGTDYEVLLGLLGNTLLEQKGWR